MEQRLACLERSRESLAALVEVAAQADEEVVTRLPSMVEALAPVGE